MTESTSHTLVNFRASRSLLKAFDDVCFLSGKTRTMVLSEMMRQRILSVGSKLPAKLALQEDMEKRVRTAVEARSTDETVEGRRSWSSAFYERLKPFSSFNQPVV